MARAREREGQNTARPTRADLTRSNLEAANRAAYYSRKGDAPPVYTQTMTRAERTANARYQNQSQYDGASSYGAPASSAGYGYGYGANYAPGNSYYEMHDVEGGYEGVVGEEKGGKLTRKDYGWLGLFALFLLVCCAIAVVVTMGVQSNWTYQ